MNDVTILFLSFVLIVVVFLVSVVTAVGVSWLICCIHMRRSNENNTVDFYNNYISRIPIQILRSHDLR